VALRRAPDDLAVDHTAAAAPRRLVWPCMPPEPAWSPDFQCTVGTWVGATVGRERVSVQ
jgi:hypothetical protein